MKVVILAGGYGTRLSEETQFIPKPMVDIDSEPILLHIIKIFSHYGFNEFIICLGYKSYVIKSFFSNYYLNHSDITFDLQKNEQIIHQNDSEPWTITLVETGMNTMTGGRIKRIEKYVNNQPFMLTYGDCVGDINIKKLVEHHKKHRKLATVTAVQPHGRFGSLKISPDNNVKMFQEKVKGEDGWINAGFFVLQPEVFNYIKDDDSIIFERGPLESLAKNGQLQAYKHTGFWHPMDNLRDKHFLEGLSKSGKAPWKTWK